MTKSTLTVVLTTLAVSFLAGCASDLEPAEGAPESHVATVSDEADNVAPAATNTSGGPSGCTTTKSCDASYCCTTETCQYSTVVTCVPAPKRTKSGTLAIAQ